MRRVALKFLITAVAVVVVACPTATPAFAGTAANPAATQTVLTGCQTPAQLETAASTDVANWASNAAAGLANVPAGVTVNGQWYPAEIVATYPAAASAFTCPTPSLAAAVTLNVEASQAVLAGCVTGSQLVAAATMAVAAWAYDESSFGTSLPAGVTVNGQWQPALLLLGGTLPTSAVMCPAAT